MSVLASVAILLPAAALAGEFASSWSVSTNENGQIEVVVTQHMSTATTCAMARKINRMRAQRIALNALAKTTAPTSEHTAIVSNICLKSWRKLEDNKSEAVFTATTKQGRQDNE